MLERGNKMQFYCLIRKCYKIVEITKINLIELCKQKRANLCLLKRKKYKIDIFTSDFNTNENLILKKNSIYINIY